ncbi:hypothetical protein NG895_09370 [Aeoliella sp. ICT_H6.2]|uniref:Uncharacterized protein n=1 Tax=Aeoliella straminimaris TaxID=2954799 RepID=A0A9X2FGW3_9BACT|nr:hypothetical protein [Aeoliella straminimaris]MCO6044116.1 hypothetical protein [Aeoliella straminimaris]
MTTNRREFTALFSMLLIGSFGIAGCATESTDDGVESSAPPAAAGAHDHPTEGPHHGSLVELGNDEYHAEMLHNEDTGGVTIYILDSTAKKAVPIDAQKITVNLSHDGQAEQFALAADPDAGDPAGKASRFVSTDAELGEELDHDHADVQLVVSVAGKQFRGTLQHDHDHEDDH